MCQGDDCTALLVPLCLSAANCPGMPVLLAVHYHHPKQRQTATPAAACRGLTSAELQGAGLRVGSLQPTPHAAASQGSTAVQPGQPEGRAAPTWPTAKGRVLLKEKTSWWTPLLRKTSFTIWPRWLSKKESCTGTADSVGLSWARLDDLGLRGFLTDCCQTLHKFMSKSRSCSRASSESPNITPHKYP